MTISEISWFRYSVPLAGSIRLAGAEFQVREGLIVKLVSTAGTVGWGEASPLFGFHGWKSIDELVDEASTVKIDRIEDWLGPELRSGQSPALAFALSSAMNWLELAQAGETILANPIRTTLLITSMESLARIPDIGLFGAVKLKVGGNVDHDASRFSHVCTQVPESVKVRIDANRSWSFDQAARFIRNIDVDRLDFFEEPIDEFDRVNEFRTSSGVRVAADETLQEARGEAELRELVELADVLVIKPTMTGSHARCRMIAEMMRSAGKESVYSSAYETGVGMLGVVSLIDGQGYPSVPGIGTYRKIDQDILATRLPIDGPQTGVGLQWSSVQIRMDKLVRVI